MEAKSKVRWKESEWAAAENWKCRELRGDASNIQASEKNAEIIPSLPRQPRAIQLITKNTSPGKHLNWRKHPKPQQKTKSKIKIITKPVHIWAATKKNEFRQSSKHQDVHGELRQNIHRKLWRSTVQKVAHTYPEIQQECWICLASAKANSHCFERFSA